MSDTNISPWLKRVEKTLELTIQSIRNALNVKAVIILVIHNDATTQTSAAVTPGIEQRAAFALRAMADKIESGKDVRVEMPDKFKN